MQTPIPPRFLKLSGAVKAGADLELPGVVLHPPSDQDLVRGEPGQIDRGRAVLGLDHGAQELLDELGAAREVHEAETPENGPMSPAGRRSGVLGHSGRLRRATASRATENRVSIFFQTFRAAATGPSRRQMPLSSLTSPRRAISSAVAQRFEGGSGSWFRGTRTR